MTRESQTKQAWLGVAVLALGGATLLGACSSNSTGSSASAAKPAASAHSPMPSATPTGTPTGTPARTPTSTATGTPAATPNATSTTISKASCKHINSLRGSLQDLSSTKLTPASASKVSKDLTNVQTQVAALKTQGGGQFAAEANQLTASISQIEKAAHGLATNPVAGGKQLTTAINQLKSIAQPMIVKMRAACPTV